jgi:streptomycin 6-kinase
VLNVKLYDNFKAMQKADFEDRAHADIVAYEDGRGGVHIVKHRDGFRLMMTRAEFDAMVKDEETAA